MSRDIPVAAIRPDPRQPRKHFDQHKLDELAQSIRENGLLSSILVRPNGEGYLIVHGERRFRAVQSLGWQTIRCDVRELGDTDAARLALVENIQREDLSAMEEARAYRFYLDQTGQSQQAMGEAIGKSQSYIAQKLRLLTLDEPLKVLMDESALSEGHMRQLLRLRRFFDGSSYTYQSETRDGVSIPPVDEWSFRNDPEIFISSYFICRKPLEQCPCLYDFDDPDNPKWPHVGNVIASIETWTRASGWTVPIWVEHATYWGLVAYIHDFSVSELSNAIDLYMRLIRCAIQSQIADKKFRKLTEDILKREANGTKLNPVDAVLIGHRKDLVHSSLWDERGFTGAKSMIPETIDERLPFYSSATCFERYEAASDG